MFDPRKSGLGDENDDDPDAPMSATAALSRWLSLSARADRGAKRLDAHARDTLGAAPARREKAGSDSR